MPSTRIYAITVGLITASVGVIHGIYEVAQGNRPTGGVVLGNIGAITVVPNYLITGIAAIIIGLAMIFWTAGFIHRNQGPLVFLCLSILLVLFGGGIALIAGIIITWAVASRINKPVSWFNKHLPGDLCSRLSRLWPAIFTTGLVLLGVGIGIWLVLLPPGRADKQLATEYVCWSFLGVGLLFQILTIVSGFIRDSERAKTGNT